MAFEAIYLGAGDRVDHTPSGNIAAGEVVVINKTCFVATEAIAASTLGSLVSRGVFTMAKKTNLTITAGDACYWCIASNYITKTTTDVYCGVALADAALNATTVTVHLRSIQEAIAEQFGLADLSDVHTSTATNGNLLIADGVDFESTKLTGVSLATLAAGAVGPVEVIYNTCTAGGAEDEVVIASTPYKLRILDAYMISRDTNAANVKLHSGTAGVDDITEAKAKGGTDDAIVHWATIVAEQDEIAASDVIKANFSASASVDVVILCVPIA